MAASFVDYVNVLDSDGSVSASITIPATSDYCVCVVSGFVSGADRTCSVMTLDGTTMLPVSFSVDGTGDGNGVRLFGCNVTSTGAGKTYAATWDGAWTEGGQAILLFFSGIDQTTAIRDSDGGGFGIGGGTVDKTLTTVAGDICCVAGSGFSDTSVDVDLVSQTKIFEENTTAFNSDFYGAAYKVASGASTQMQMSGNYIGAAMCSLIPATGANNQVFYLKA